MKKLSKRTRMYVRISMLVMLAMIVVAAGLAPSIQASQVSAVQTSQHVEPRPDDTRPTMDEAVAELLNESEGPVNLMLELHGLPATVAYAQAGGTGKSASANAVQAGKVQADRNEQAQQTVLQSLSRLAPTATVLFRVQKAYNGIAVLADAQAVEQMRNIAGIKAIHVLPLHERDNAYAVQLTGAYLAWQGANGLTGDNISIGIIDTGIDYLHTNMGGPGTGYNVYTDTTPRAVTAAAGVFPNSKVVGGYDFAGNNYGTTGVPLPDDNPLDCPSTLGGGHGSHVAGTAAGYGVNADGTTYTGTYSSLTPTQLNAMRIGPGTAPKADLYALRVFGCTGSTSLTVAAIDWATDPNSDDNFSDHLDIINMSLGAAFGTSNDPSAAATENAALIGVQVVTSAGNSGDTHFINGSPGTSTWALSVANIHDAVSVLDAFRVNTPTVISGVKPASKSANYNWASPPVTNPVPITRTVYYPATNQYGCTAWTGTDAANINDRIVLVDWKKPGDLTFPAGCGSAVRTNNARNAGARGIIMVDTTIYPDTTIAGNADIPAMYTVKQVGDELKSQLTAGQPSNVEVTLTNEYANSTKLVVPTANDLVVSSTSRGPRTKDNAIKPDIAAPGQTIFSTDAGTGTHGKSIGGTSMASPHVAGVMALMHELHPDWSLEERKALLMNTAINDLFTDPGQTGTKFSPQRVGTGRLHVPTALDTDVVFYNADVDGAVGVSFGAVEVLGTATLTRTVEVANKGTTPVSYQIAYDPRSTVPGVSYSFPGGNVVNVPAGGTATFIVQLNADASQMKNTHDPTMTEVQQAVGLGLLPRHWMSEASGLITLTPSHVQGPKLRLSVYSSIRPASAMSAAQESLVFPNANSSTNLNLTGQGVNTGAAYPYDIKSVVSAMEVATTSGEITLTTSVPANAKTADLQYVGVTSDAPARATITQSVIFFGIVTYADFSVPTVENTYRVDIDLNRDGTVDRRLLNLSANDGTNQLDIHWSILSANPPNFTQGTFQDYLNWYPPNVLATAIFNNNVLVLPVKASSLYTNTANTRFNYRVATLSRFFGTGTGIIDQTDWLTYDPANPGLDFTGGIPGLPMYNDLPGNSIPVTYNEAAFQANGSLGALLLHHYNTKGNRAEVLEVFTEGQLTATPTATGTSTSTSTVAPSGTSTRTSTVAPSSTSTVAPSATAIACTIEFSDVPPGSTFHPFVKCLACKGVLSGYPDGTFRPGNFVTRGQIAKIVSNAAGFNEEVEGQTYSDVPPSDSPSSFYPFVERLSSRNIIGGYPCGSDVDGDGDVDEECDDVSRAFFRPGNTATRAQLSKIVSNAAGFTNMVSGQTFADVPPSSDPSSFYVFVERLAQRNVMGGYPCGGPGEPCTGGNRPYFRPGANVTRGQAAKIVANTFFPNCNTNLPAPTATATLQPVATNTQTIPGPTSTPQPQRP
ncbi:MAG: S8 family serine peptidase [Chloroflexota bacterium]|nr:S8 family serine peptidase [Chloroflexota bacterium]MDQ5864761.1 S8 family serine peptidase [Chloroflexota bacterium]